MDDSATARAALRLAIESEPEIEVVGESADGASTLQAVARMKPDLVTMDVFLGRENGLDIASTIMQRAPCPILVVTAADSTNPQLLYRSLQVGALEVCAKLPGPNHSSYELRRKRLLRTIRTLARVPVIRRHRAVQTRPALDLPRSEPPPAGEVGLIVIGASTGGPPVVAEILGALPSPFPVPIAIAQHIVAEFATAHCAWLGDASGHRTMLIDGPRALQRGEVYLARGDRHLELLSRSRITVTEGPPVHHQRPAVDQLFASAARHVGRAALGVLLTGMGRDGCEGMRLLHRAGALTLAQAPGTCVVDAMPLSAIEAAVVTHQASPLELAQWIGEASKSPLA